MKIAIASLENPAAVSTWSGIPYHIIASLQAIGHHLTPITLKRPKEPWYYNWLRRFYYRLQKGWFLSSVEKRILQVIGKQLDAEVSNCTPDVVIVIHGDLLAYTTFKQPACTIHDTTFATLVDYYSDFTNLSSRSVRAGNIMYQKAMDRTNAAVFSAKWASDSAISDYKINPKKVHTIPFGANLTRIPHEGDVSQWIINRSLSRGCNFLFLGINWERKGGRDALRFVKALNAKGVPGKLMVVGCTAVVAADDEIFIEQIGFLNKNSASEKQRLEELLVNCQALLVPSLAECYGCVYCEANAYGLPALSRNTGGVAEIIKDGLNGLLLEIDETPESFADRWLAVWQNKEHYISMAKNARNEYEERLNYTVFAKQLEKVLSKLVCRNPEQIELTKAN